MKFCKSEVFTEVDDKGFAHYVGKGIFGSGLYLVSDPDELDPTHNHGKFTVTINHPLFFELNRAEFDTDRDCPAHDLIKATFNVETYENMIGGDDFDGLFGDELRNQLLALGYDGIVVLWPRRFDYPQIIAFDKRQLSNPETSQASRKAK